jgi:hypothetical protein
MPLVESLSQCNLDRLQAQTVHSSAMFTLVCRPEYMFLFSSCSQNAFKNSICRSVYSLTLKNRREDQHLSVT